MLVPGPISELGQMLRLAGRALVLGARRPYAYGPELINELRVVIGVCFWPMILTSFALSFGPAGIQASNFFGLFGAFDRLGGAYQLIVVREFAPLVTVIILAGAAGTAVCADLAARTVREEIDALQVLAVDTVKHLVVPRMLAIVIAAVLFNTFAIVAGLLGAVLVMAQNGQALGPFFANFFANATPLELGASLGKCLMFGVMVAVVSCHKGLTVTGGAEGVGRAVNQAVTTAFLAVGFLDYFFTQLLLATHPLLSQVRG